MSAEPVADAAHQLLLLTARAVEAARGEDDKVGMSLSGGVDSSSVYVLTGRPSLPCFTGYYEGDAYDERFFARLVAGDEHHEILITPEDFVEHFDEMTLAAKPPYQGPGTFGQYMVARYACEHVTVMLSGEGGDELFGGYARLMIAAGEPRPDGYEDYVPPAGYPTDLKAALQWDFDRLGDLLAVDDQMLGAFGIEARAPFTDPDVVDFVLSLPPESRVGKRLLKEAMRGLVPDAILDRTDKRGFPIPIVQWANEHEGVRQIVLDRIGYLPDPAKPFAREWWVALCTQTRRELGF
jgi:asparagine synthetase B (glutamine-hydrolysing)